MRAYQEADIFVLSSYAIRGWEELFGIVVIEAYATALPAVATDCLGPREVVADGVDGLLIPQQEADSLVSANSRLATNPEMRMAMGRKAREKAERRFSIDVTAAKWPSLIT